MRSLATVPCSIKKCLHDYQLIDIWRTISPTGWDYTCYSPPHDSYNKIDLFLLKHHDLARVVRAGIGVIMIK